MKSEVATVRRVTLSRNEVEEATIEHIEAFHDPQLQLILIELLLSIDDLTIVKIKIDLTMTFIRYL